MRDIVRQALIHHFPANGLWTTFLLLLLAAQACAAAGSAGRAQPQNPVLPQPLAGLLPAPAECRSVSAVTGVLRLGREFETGLPYNRAQAVGDSASFTPEYASSASPLWSLSYAVYGFNLSDFSGTPVLHLTWDVSADDTDAWLGLANFTHNHWDWVRIPAAVGNESLLMLNLADYTRSSDQALFAAVVFTGSAPWLLQRLALGTVAPAPGWVHGWGGTGEDNCYCLAVAPATGEVTTGGSTKCFGAGSSDVFLIRYSQDGALLWQKTWGTAEYDSAHGLALDGAGNLYAVGGSGADAQRGVLLLKLDPAGNLLRSSAWGTDDPYCGGNAIAAAADGTVYCLATVMHPIIVDETYISQYDIGLLKFAPDGALEWQKTWGGLHGDEFSGIAIDPAGGCYIVGTLNYFDQSGFKCCLLKFNANGGIAWARTYTHASGRTVQAFSVTRGDNGHLYLGGGMYVDATSAFQTLLIETTADGALIRACGWDGPGDDLAYSVAVAPSGVAHLVGYSYSFDTETSADGLIVSIAADSALLGAYTNGIPHNEEQLYDAACDALGRLYCAGLGSAPVCMAETAVSGVYSPSIPLVTGSEGTSSSDLTGSLIELAGAFADQSGFTDGGSGESVNVITLQRVQ